MHTFDKRKVAIMAAILLGVLAVLYIGGIVGQLHANYQQWLASDGMTGDGAMKPIQFNPLLSFAFAFTGDGIKSVLFTLLAVGGILLYIKLNERFSSKDTDDRNFARSKAGTYGTAGWMGEKDMKDVLEVAPPAKARGTILGKKGGAVICLPDDTRLNKHVAIFGASGTMKSRAIIRNQLFQAIKRGESVIVTDSKSELYADTAELFRQQGYAVKIFNLVQPDHSDSWNCMADLNGDTLMAQVLTDVIITNTSEGRADHFWDNGEGNLLKALVLYVDQDASRGMEEKHLPAVYQLLVNNSERQLSAMFGKLPINHPAKAPYNLFAQSSDTVRTGIVLGLGTRLQVLQNDAVRKVTSQSDIDLAEPGRSKCAYFVILSDQEGSLDFLSSLFFSFLFIRLVRYADSQPDGRCKVPVNIVLDEGNNIGTIPDFARRLSTIRSRQCHVMYVSQNLPQCQNRYPNNLWAEILGNMDTHLLLGCSDDITAGFFSMRSGDMTVEVNSTMTVRQSIAVAQMIPQYRQTEGKGRRRLLTPDEILRLPNDELLIIMRGQQVLKAKKFDYTGHPMAKEIQRISILDYTPNRIAAAAPALQTETEKDQSLKAEPAGKLSAITSLYSTAKPPEEF